METIEALRTELRAVTAELAESHQREAALRTRTLDASDTLCIYDEDLGAQKPPDTCEACPLRRPELCALEKLG